MTLSYPKIKKIAIDLLDDFFKGDLQSLYGPGAAYSSKTKLDEIDVTAPVRAVMITRVNKVLARTVGADWYDVRAVDTVKCASIGDFIKLVCKNAGVGLPVGEPK